MANTVKNKKSTGSLRHLPRLPRLPKPWDKVALTVVVLCIIGGGYYAYHQYGPSQVSDASTKAELQKASSDLKSIDLAGVKSTIQSVQSVQGSFKK